MRYRTKVVEKRAILFLAGVNYEQVCEFVGKELQGNRNGTGVIQELIIETLEGEMTALNGDYIIEGLNGEFYPCKPDIFEKSYEPIFE